MLCISSFSEFLMLHRGEPFWIHLSTPEGFVFFRDFKPEQFDDHLLCWCVAHLLEGHFDGERWVFKSIEDDFLGLPSSFFIF